MTQTDLSIIIRARKLHVAENGNALVEEIDDITA